MPQPTIAALATPWGAGALAVIRISGPGALSIVRGLGGLPSTEVESHRALLRTLRTPDGDPLDQALVLPFVGPRSFTGEDVVELHCHGGEVTVRRVLDALHRAGARAAEPGEFSRRALLNGKLDVVQVEAIADVVHAESEAAQRLAQAHLAGRLSAEIDRLKAALVELVVLVEAAIDFSLEEHVFTIGPAEIADRLAPVASGVAALLETYDAGRLCRDGVRVAIVGPPNAGKSTLLNRLLRHERAIVTEVPGTTRDTIEESVAVGGVRYHLVDTAGIRDTADRVEQLGVERSRRALEASDVALFVADASAPEPALETLSALSVLGSRPWALVLNKTDLAPAAVLKESFTRLTSLRAPSMVVETSLGLTAEVSAIEAALSALATSAGLRPGSESVLLSRARHRDLLEDARGALTAATEAASIGLGHELIATDLRSALHALGSLTGAVTSDDVLAKIFGEFCIGK